MYNIFLHHHYYLHIGPAIITKKQNAGKQNIPITNNL